MKKFRISLYILLFLAIIVLAFFYLAPFGKMTYRHNFSKQYLLGKGFFHKFGPSERIINNRIMGDPVYFYLNSPRNFSQAKLKIKYRISPKVLDNNEYINIETGVLVDKENWQYSLRPVFNNILIDLSNNSNVLNDDNLFFYQKRDRFKNYQDFLNNNDFSSSVFYNFNFDGEYFLSDYQPLSNKENLVIKNIRGSHSFFVYLKDEDLKIDFSFIKESRNNKIDLSNALSIFVYCQDKIIFSEDNLSFKDNNLEYLLNLPGLPEGAYRIEIKTSDDVLIKNIKTKLSKLVFINKVWLDSQETGFILFSNRNNFRVKALESLCLGDVEINNNIFTIDKIFQQFNIENDYSKKDSNELTKIKSNSCGFLIENNGLFSFSEYSFFDPTINKLDKYTDIKEIEFILADFSVPQKIDDYYISEIDLNLENAIREKDGYSFVISTPFLKNLDNSQYIEIIDLKIDLTGKNLFTKIKEEINEKFKR